MAFTRAYDDKERINRFLDRDVNQSQYMLNVPGNGTKPYYIEDPHIRLQKFGGNLSYNVTNVNSGLKGLGRQLDTDCITKKDTNKQMLNNNYSEINFPKNSTIITNESRTTMPAWQLRGLEQNNWNYLHSNPQNHIESQFENNISSRILEKDSYNFKCANNQQNT